MNAAAIETEFDVLTVAQNAASPLPRLNQNILALDLGTRAGYALQLRDGTLASGSTSFAAKRNEGPGQRWLKFRTWLAVQQQLAGELHAIYYEDVKGHGPGVQAAHVYGGFLAHLESWAEMYRIPLIGVAVGTIKKHATGRGNAKKPEMIAAMEAKGFVVVDDNHADALALLGYALESENES